MPRLSIYLLGDFRVRLVDRMITRMFRTDKERALLAFLAVESERPHSRDMLSEILWPDRPEGVARTNLRQALMGVRKAIGDRKADSPFLIVQDEYIQFDSKARFWLDTVAFTARFQTALKHPHISTYACLQCAQGLQEAVDLYRQDFFDGIYLESQGFQEWVTFQREQYFRYLIMALDQLSEFFQYNGEFETAHKYAAQYVKRAPLEEKAHRRLMELLALNGRRTAAIEQYLACRQILNNELGLDPSHETQKLFEKIRDGQTLQIGQVLPSPAVLPGQAGPDLPLQLTTFIDRKAELDWAERCLANPACRLITVVGMAGAGKSRMAIEIAARNAHLFSDGVKYLSLEAVASPELLLLNIARAFGLSIGLENTFSHLLRQLSDRTNLILIDHFDAFAHQTDLLLQILSMAPGIKILLTSRRRLNYQAACLLQIGGLAYPTGEPTLQEAEAYPAVQMFLKRAERTQPRFGLTEDNLVHIIEICRQVEGNPLGIELAAASLRHQTPRQIAYGLRFSLSGLETSLMDIPERHRKMEGAIDESWSLLSEVEKRSYSALSVFQGEFTDQAARQVADVARGSLIDLVEASMLEECGPDRYRMHPLLKSYAANRLAVRPDTKKFARDRHSKYYLDFLCSFKKQLESPHKSRAARYAIEAEIDNILLALDHAVALQKQAAIRKGMDCLEIFAHLPRTGPLETPDATQYLVAVPTAKSEFSFVAEMLQASGFFGSGEQHLEQASNAILVTDREHKITAANFRATKLTGYSKEALLKLSIDEIEPGATAHQAAPMNEEDLYQGIAQFRTTLLHPDGEQIPVEVYRFPFFSEGQVLTMSIIRAIEEVAQLPLDEISKTKPITGLLGLQDFIVKLRQGLSQAANRGQQVAILVLDINDFTAINQKYGYSSGDKLLREVAARLRANMRGRDTIAHLGGDKFTFLLEDVPRQDNVAVVIDKIQSNLQAPFQIEDDEISLSGRIGVSIYPNDGDDPETLIENAARMVYSDD